MRTRVVAMTVGVGLGALVLVPALPASGRAVSPLNLKALTNSINRSKNLTYLAQYTSVSDGQKTTVTIAQSPPKSNFSTSTGSVINNGKTTYYCSTNSASTGNSGNSGSTSNSSNSGNSGNSGASTTTSTISCKRSMQCLSVKGSNPLLGLEDIFSPTVALGALAEAKEGIVSRLLGIKVSSSSGTFAGQPSTCVTVTVRAKGGKYCVTKQGLLSYSGSSSSSYFELTKYSSKPPASLFSLPTGATTETLPGGTSIP
ncbi:MAG: hypothetical protein ABSG39_10065 [Acidimicrobiales bacterium]